MTPITITYDEADGRQYMATRADFKNLHDSPAGYGNTPEVALADLLYVEAQAEHLPACLSARIAALASQRTLLRAALAGFCSTDPNNLHDLTQLRLVIASSNDPNATMALAGIDALLQTIKAP